MDPFLVNPSSYLPQSLNCQIHNKPGVVMNPYSSIDNRLVFCDQCLQPVEDYQKENSKKFDEILEQNKIHVDHLNSSIQQLHDCREKFAQSINKIIGKIEQQRESIKSQQIKFNNQYSSQLILTSSINQEHQECLGTYFQFQKNVLDLNSIIKVWSTYLIGPSSLIKQKKWLYQKISNPIPQPQNCWALAANLSTSILVAGNNDKINVYEFANEQLNFVFQLQGHIKTITSLKFMKTKEQFISGSAEGQIILWEFKNQLENIWNSFDHQGRVNCLQIMKEEDQFLSGSGDKTIKLWKLGQNSISCIQTVNFSHSVWDTCFNDSNSKLFVLIDNQQIIIFEKDVDIWIEIKIMQLPADGVRIQGIDDNQLAVQLDSKNPLLIFNYDSIENTFQIQQKIQVKLGVDEYTLFPIQFIKQKNLLIVKKCQYINVLKKNNRGEFILEQTLDFGSKGLYGCANEDGRFLFTWDVISSEIQTWKLIEAD